MAWFSEECKNQSNVVQYVEALKKHINVDIYGPCGDLKCSLEAQVVFYKDTFLVGLTLC